MKTTFNVRRPQNIKSEISQLPLIGSYLDFKLNLKMKNTSAFLKTMTHISEGRFRGHPRGNLECLCSAHLVFHDKCKKTELPERRGRGGPGPLKGVVEKN